MMASVHWTDLPIGKYGLQEFQWTWVEWRAIVQDHGCFAKHGAN